jgi:hypothetical protein
LATFTGFFLFLLGGILATATLSTTPFFFAKALAAPLRVTRRTADLVSGAIVNNFSNIATHRLHPLDFLRRSTSPHLS